MTSRRFGLIAAIILAVALSFVAVAVYALAITPTTSTPPVRHGLNFAAELPPPCRPSPPTGACAYDEIPIVCGYTELKCMPMQVTP